MKRATDSYLRGMKLRVENLERKERILRNLLQEERKVVEENSSEQSRILKARGLLIQELLKKKPDLVRSLMVPVVKEMNLTKNEAKRVLTNE